VTARGWPARVSVEGNEVTELDAEWALAACAPGACADASAIGSLDWLGARVPGTVADALRDAGLETDAIDERDWWFRTRFEAAPVGEGEEVVLVLDGLATVAEVYLNGVVVLSGESMFARSQVDVSRQIAGENELVICCRALAPLLAESRRPRQRWRQRVVADATLRFYRTMLIGRAAGFAPGPPVIGPWRALRIERRARLAVDALELRPRIEDGAGVLAASIELRTLGAEPLDGLELELAGHGDPRRVRLECRQSAAGVSATGEIRVADVVRWWPHTHGDPALYDVRLVASVGGAPVTIDAGRVGFRELGGGEELEARGLQLEVNGVPVFVRGAVWMALEAAGPAPSAADLRSALESVRSGGMNMLRIPGTGAYESPAFYDLCDELGILLWQDFMFANLDYPESDPAFMEAVEREVDGVLRDLGGRPSLVALCGSSEVAQQVAMVGLDPELASGALFGELLPSLVADAGLDAVYVPSAPWGGAMPFRPDRGIASYFGVGGYRRPLEDARRANVLFAAECLAIANVPDEEIVAQIAPELAGAAVLRDARWNAAAPRDPGATWDFHDVRDHYLGVLFAVEPSELRETDPERYLELSRAVSGEVMAEVFGEWRRGDTRCGGGIILCLRDLAPGAGWGVLDSRGEPKVVYHHLRRILAPRAVWSTDDGQSGIVAHVANDGPGELRANLRIGLYRDFELGVGEVVEPVVLAPHSRRAYDVEGLLGRFVDISWAYRFGPPAQDVVALSLEREHDGVSELISQAFRLPAGRPSAREGAPALGLVAALEQRDARHAVVRVESRRFAYGVRIHCPGFRAADNAFSIEPGGVRHIELTATAADGELGDATLTALNLDGAVALR
jgi:beta-mannosidase